MNLILKFLPVDTRAPASRARRIPALDHEILDDPMKDHPVIVARLSQRREVLACLGGMLIIELYYYCALLFSSMRFVVLCSC